jgi:splicing factor 3A subunit 3
VVWRCLRHATHLRSSHTQTHPQSSHAEVGWPGELLVRLHRVIQQHAVQDEYVYNPLKLPLGPDGKPIPYWLYKLHGLNQEFKCDICGGDIFRGRREYERHFRESKHVQAMAALGIPSSKAFFEVTKVEEAIALWNNLQKRNAGNWNPELQEEFEDEEGNVYNRRTYMDLHRQGLV